MHVQPLKPYVRIDDHGVYRVGDTHVMFDSVLAGFEQGERPETIHQNYPSITLEQVYGSIANYLANRQEVDAYLAQQKLLWKELRKESRENPSPVMARLRALQQTANMVEHA